MNPTPVLHKVYKFQSGMVMCFDENGEQITKLQGPFEDVRERVLAAVSPVTKFYDAKWKHSAVEIDSI